MEPWVELYYVVDRVVLSKLGELISSSIWIVVLAGLGFGVSVLSRGRCPGGGGSSSGWRGFCHMLRLLEWDFYADFLYLFSVLVGFTVVACACLLDRRVLFRR